MFQNVPDITPTGRLEHMNELYLNAPASQENNRFVPLYCGILLTAGLALFLFIACSPAAKQAEILPTQTQVSTLD